MGQGVLETWESRQHKGSIFVSLIQMIIFSLIDLKLA